MTNPFARLFAWLGETAARDDRRMLDDWDADTELWDAFVVEHDRQPTREEWRAIRDAARPAGESVGPR